MQQDSRSVDGIESRITNKIYDAVSQMDTKFAYNDLINGIFTPVRQKVDFGNRVAVAATMNDWSAKETNNLIENLIDPGKFWNIFQNQRTYLHRLNS